MALIKCPECQTEVSDKALSCPKCACPIIETKQSVNAGRKQLIKQLFQKHKIQTILSISLFLIGVIGGVVGRFLDVPGIATMLCPFVAILGMLWLMIIMRPLQQYNINKARAKQKSSVVIQRTLAIIFCILIFWVAYRFITTEGNCLFGKMRVIEVSSERVNVCLYEQDSFLSNFNCFNGKETKTIAGTVCGW